MNKLNTKAEVRFHVLNADWMPDEVKQRLFEQQANRINNNGELLVTSQENRYTPLHNITFYLNSNTNNINDNR